MAAELNRIKKGMILAAGMGTRMAPVTEHCPKPLIPVLNVPNIVHNIFLLKSAGIEEIVINAFHLGDQIVSAIGDGKRYGVRIHYSIEKDLLGTGGGVKAAESYFSGETIVLCNCDLVTDIELGPVVERHFARGALATMILLDDPETKKKYANVGTTGGDRLCQLPSLKTAEPDRTGTFTGIHVLHPDTMKFLQPVFSGINQVLYPELMRRHPDRVFGHFAEQGALWLDTGEVPVYLSTSLRLIELLESGNAHLGRLMTANGYWASRKGIWRASEEAQPAEILPTAILGDRIRFGGGVKIGPTVVLGDDCVIGEGAHIERSIVLPGGRVPAGARITDAIVYLDKIIHV